MQNQCMCYKEAGTAYTGPFVMHSNHQDRSSGTTDLVRNKQIQVDTSDTLKEKNMLHSSEGKDDRRRGKEHKQEDTVAHTLWEGDQTGSNHLCIGHINLVLANHN